MQSAGTDILGAVIDFFSNLGNRFNRIVLKNHVHAFSSQKGHILEQ